MLCCAWTYIFSGGIKLTDITPNKDDVAVYGIQMPFWLLFGTRPIFADGKSGNSITKTGSLTQLYYFWSLNVVMYVPSYVSFDCCWKGGRS